MPVGVTRHSSGKFTAKITLDGTLTHLGQYSTKSEASERYLKEKANYLYTLAELQTDHEIKAGLTAHAVSFTNKIGENNGKNY